MIPGITVTKSFSFCYGHYLPLYNGKCANQHGHTAKLEVEVANRSYDLSYVEDAMVLDYKTLKALVEPLLHTLDHNNLNEVKVNGEWLFTEEFPPTSENILSWIVTNLQKIVPACNCMLVRVRLYESETSYAEWRR